MFCRMLIITIITTQAYRTSYSACFEIRYVGMNYEQMLPMGHSLCRHGQL